MNNYVAKVEEAAWCRDADGNYLGGRPAHVSYINISATSLDAAEMEAYQILRGLSRGPWYSIMPIEPHRATIYRITRRSGKITGKMRHITFPRSRRIPAGEEEDI